jgi:hypothetical protein
MANMPRIVSERGQPNGGGFDLKHPPTWVWYGIGVVVAIALFMWFSKRGGTGSPITGSSGSTGGAGAGVDTGVAGGLAGGNTPNVFATPSTGYNQGYPIGSSKGSTPSGFVVATASNPQGSNPEGTATSFGSSIHDALIHPPQSAFGGSNRLQLLNISPGNPGDEIVGAISDTIVSAIGSGTHTGQPKKKKGIGPSITGNEATGQVNVNTAGGNMSKVFQGDTSSSSSSSPSSPAVYASPGPVSGERGYPGGHNY